MVKEKVNIKDRSFDGAGIKKDTIGTIIEFILNGFEANASSIKIFAESYSKEMDMLSKLEIIDDGEGIPYETKSETFGTFLISQKEKNVFFDRANKGKGRYTFENICNNAIWTTVYAKEGKHYKYSIKINKTERDFCEYSDLEETDEPTGTKVEFNGLSNLKIQDVTNEDFKLGIAVFFAKFLYLYKSKHIYLNNEEIHYNLVIDEDLSTTFIETIEGINFSVNFIKWLDGSNQKSLVYYVDENYIEHHKEHTKCNNNAVKFYHSIFIQSDYFNKFVYTATNEPILSPYINQTNFIFKKLQDFVFKYAKQMLKKFIQEEVPGIVQSYIDDGLFPSFSDDPYSEQQKTELKSVVESVYCVQPNLFYKSKKEHKIAIIGCLNLILKTDERENIITILDSIQQLTPEEREQLANTLRKYEPKSVVKLLNTIESRYSIIEKLKVLIFDNEKFTNERNHIQNIIENNYWLFGEGYNLVSADERLDAVLIKYIDKLDVENKTDVSYDNPLYKARRPDIFISGNHNTSTVQENIIVELKAPHVKIDIRVYRQIEDYMLAVYKDPEFNSKVVDWKFICVGKELSEDIIAKRNAYKQYNKHGLVNIVDNFEVYAFTWADIFTMFTLRHEHLYGKLKNRSVEAASKDIVPSRQLADEYTADIKKLSDAAN